MADHDQSRAITGLEWMSKHTDLLLASYSKREEYVLGEQDGLVKIWATTMRTRPEVTLVCQSEVTQVISHPFRQNEIIGGTYAGYVVLWDIRAKKTPVLKSQLTNEAHSFPIYSLAVVGTEKANTIVSVANNGRLCVWSMEMLTSPQKNIDLKYNAKEICGTCIAFPQEESNNFYIGSEDTAVYCAQIHATGVGPDPEKSNISNALLGHCAPVTSLATHPTPSTWLKAHDYSHIMLSTSMDWSIKLWNPKKENAPIASFENSQDYALDAKWSPVHPSLFAAVDAEGYVDLWDINSDMEAPIAHQRKEPRTLNKVSWSLDGKRLATGNSNGVINVYSVDKEVKLLA